MEEIYSRTDIYDLFQTVEYEEEIRKHWKVIQEETGIKTFLDCCIGTGNLTLPAAELGIEISGSDLSREMLDACKKKAQNKKYSVNLKQSDFRNLSKAFDGQFDCVGSTGNSLPHVNNEDILTTLEQMDQLVKKGGYLYFDMRNWDKILYEKKRFYLYPPQFKDEIRVNLIQVWDYNQDDTMDFHLLYTFEKENSIFQKEEFTEHYYPIKREMLIDKLKNMGYEDIKVMCHPTYFQNVDLSRVDWYCVVAKKGM